MVATAHVGHDTTRPADAPARSASEPARLCRCCGDERGTVADGDDDSVKASGAASNSVVRHSVQ